MIDILEASLFVGGIILSEAIFRRKKTSFYKELISLFILVILSSFILERTYYKISSKNILYFYLFFVAFSVSLISKFLTTSFDFLEEESKRVVNRNAVNRLKKITIRTVLELKKEGWDDEKIIEFAKKVGLNRRIVRKILKTLREGL